MNNKSPKQRGLGRGLTALMAETNVAAAVTEDAVSPAQNPGTRTVPIEKLIPNPDQPRKRFDETDLDDLASSIGEKGIIQPLIVRQKGEKFEIVAGERRWRAAQRARLHEVPVVVRDFTDEEVMEVAIIENVQRADLNPIEEALGYMNLQEKFGRTQEQIAQALGKSRSHLANMLRLLKLPATVQQWVESGELSMGHARALLSADDPAAAAATVISKGFSVRETEKLVKTLQNPAPFAARRKSVVEKSADTKVLEADLTSSLGMAVNLEEKTSESGRLVIEYKSLEDLEKIFARLWI